MHPAESIGPCDHPSSDIGTLCQGPLVRSRILGQLSMRLLQKFPIEALGFYLEPPVVAAYLCHFLPAFDWLSAELRDTDARYLGGLTVTKGDI